MNGYSVLAGGPVVSVATDFVKKIELPVLRCRIHIISTTIALEKDGCRNYSLDIILALTLG